METKMLVVNIINIFIFYLLLTKYSGSGIGTVIAYALGLFIGSSAALLGQILIAGAFLAYTIYSSKDDNGTSAHAHLSYWLLALCIGIIFSDLVFYFPLFSIPNINIFDTPIKNLFIR